MMRPSSTRIVAHAANAAATRAMHTSAALCTVPNPSAFAKYAPVTYRPLPGLERAASLVGSASAPYNQTIFGAEPALPAHNPNSNTQLAMKLVQRQMAAARKAGTASNILLSPISLAQGMVRDGGAAAFSDLQLQPAALKAAVETDYDALLAEWRRSGDVTMTVSSGEGKEARGTFGRAIEHSRTQEAALRVPTMSHLVRQPFPLSDPATSTASHGAVQSAMGFAGYLAPKFTSPLTKFPNYFYSYDGSKSIAHMMVKSSKMWYVEAETFQMIDLPYLNPNFVATLILPRVSADRTIQDHPDEFKYDQAPRRAATIDEVINTLATPTKNGTDVFSHHAKYMTLMNGLVGLPGFTADCTVGGHRSVLTLSPHGLDVGAKTPRVRPGQVNPNFTALFDHPFLMLIRSALPEQPQVLFAAVVSDVFKRTDFSTKFPLPAEWRQYKEQMGSNIQQLYSKVL